MEFREPRLPQGWLSLRFAAPHLTGLGKTNATAVRKDVQQKGGLVKTGAQLELIIPNYKAEGQASGQFFATIAALEATYGGDVWPTGA